MPLTHAKKFWHNRRYDSFPIQVVSVPCKGHTPFERDHELVKSFSNASARKIKENAKLSDVKKEY